MASVCPQDTPNFPNQGTPNFPRSEGQQIETSFGASIEETENVQPCVENQDDLYDEPEENGYENAYMVPRPNRDLPAIPEIVESVEEIK